MQQLKIALIGNIANNFYREAKALQGAEGLTVHLYMRKNSTTPNTELPESDGNVDMAIGYPEWIYCYSHINIKELLLYRFTRYLCKNSEQSSLIRKLNSYDLCIFSGPDLLLLPLVKTKTIFRATGSDLTVFPVFSFSQFAILRPNKQCKISDGILRFFKVYIFFYIRRYLYRQAVYKATYVSTSNRKPNKTALGYLKIPAQKQINLFRLAIETETFSYSVERERNCNNLWNLDKSSFVILMPSRIMMKDTILHRQTGQWKNSNEAITGFKLFLNSLSPSERQHAILIIPDRTLSDDLDLAKKLIEELDLGTSVRFVKGAADEGLTRQELISFYSRANVVMNDFGGGWYGSVVVEALSCSCPVITHVPSKLLTEHFPWHPLLLAQTSQEIAQLLTRLYQDITFRDQQGALSRKWVKEFHSNEVVKMIHSDNIRKILHSKPHTLNEK